MLSPKISNPLTNRVQATLTLVPHAENGDSMAGGESGLPQLG